MVVQVKVFCDVNAKKLGVTVEPFMHRGEEQHRKSTIIYFLPMSSTHPGILSGPTALPGLTLENVFSSHALGTIRVPGPPR